MQIEKQELIEALENEGAAKVAKQYRHNLLPSRLLIDLYNDEPSDEVLRFLALYPTVPSQVLQSISENCERPEILALIAQNPRCTQNLLIRMADEGTPAVRAALAGNKLHSQRITAQLVRDPNLWVRTALAKNPAISTPYQMVLAHDPQPAVRLALSGLSKIKEEVALALSEDESAVVRSQVYAASRVDADLRQFWADSDELEAQSFLLTRNKLTPAEIQSLSHSPHSRVQQTALARHTPEPYELMAWAESEVGSERLAIANRSDLPAEVQHLLAADALAEVRCALAGNPAINEEVALWIAGSNDPQTCTVLAQNPALPEAAKTELCHHENRTVQLHMAYRNDLTDTLLGILVNETGNFNLVEHLALQEINFCGTDAELLPPMLAHKRPSVRAFAAAAESLSDAQVIQLIRDPAAPVRQRLVHNPILTRTALEALSKDWNSAIAEAAQNQLQNHDVQTLEPNNATQENITPGLVSKIVRFFTE